MRTHLISLLALVAVLTGCTGNPLLGSSGAKVDRSHSPYLNTPGSFAILNATRVASTVTLRWSPSKNATQYSVWYRAAGDRTFTLVTDQATSSALMVTGIRANTAYVFRITAKNKFGTLDSPTLTVAADGSISNDPYRLALVIEPLASTPLIAGENLPTQPKVQVLNQAGEVIPQGQVQITLALYSDSECKTPLAITPNRSPSLSGTTSLVSNSGFAEAQNFSVNLARSQLFLKASANQLIPACSSVFSVSPGAYDLTQSEVTASAESVTSGSSITATLTPRDAFGNLNPTGLPDLSFIAFTSSTVGGTGLLSPPSLSAEGHYSATFTGQLAGSATLGATLSGSAVSHNASVSVIPGAIQSIVFRSAPAFTGDTDHDLSTQPVIAGKDALGNTISSYSGSIALSAYSDTACASPVQGAITATANPLSALSGLASFSGVRILKTSVQSILASDGTRSVCTGPFSISAGAPASLALSSGDTQSAIAGSPLSSPLSVLITDANHNPVPGARVTWTVSSGHGSLSSASSNTEANGMASVFWTLGTLAGSQSVQATLADLSAVNFHATATPGPATQLVFSTQPSSSPTAGATLNTQPELHLLDAHQNLVTSASPRITLSLYSNSTCSTPVTSTPSGASATSGTLELSAVNGISAFLGIKINRSGSFYLAASAEGLPLACSSLLSVSPGAYDLTQSEVTASAESVTSGSSITATLTPRDAFGNLNPTGLPNLNSIAFTSSTVGGTGLLSAPSLSAEGLYSATFTGQVAGSVTLGATLSGSAVSKNVSVSVTPGALASFVLSGLPSTTNTDTPLASPIEVRAVDASSNLITDFSGEITLVANSGVGPCSSTEDLQSGMTGTLKRNALNGMASFSGLTLTKTQIRRLRAYSNLTQGCSSLVSVSPGALASLSFSTQPQGSTADSALSTQPVVRAFDAAGNLKTDFSGTIGLAANHTGTSGSLCVATHDVSLGASGGLSVNAVSGVATFSTVQVINTQVTQLRAYSGSVQKCSDSFSIRSGVPVTGKFWNNTLNAEGLLSTGPITAGQNINAELTVLTYDSYGNSVENTGLENPTIEALSGPTCETSIFYSDDVYTFGIGGEGYPPGTMTVNSITSPAINRFRLSLFGISVCSEAFTVTPGAPAELRWVAVPSPTALVAGTTFTTQPQLALFDSVNNRITTASGSVRLTGFSGVNCNAGTELPFALGGGTTPTTVSQTLTNGVTAFSSIQAMSSSMKSIRAIYVESPSLTTCTGGLTVSPGPNQGVASQITFSQVPTSATVESPITSGISFEIHDAYHNKVAQSATAKITLYDDAQCSVPSETFTNYYVVPSITCSGPSVPDCNSLSMTSGAFTVPNFTFYRAEPGSRKFQSGSLYLRVSSGSLTADCSPAITVTPGNVPFTYWKTKFETATPRDPLPANSGGAGEPYLIQSQLHLFDYYGNYSTRGLPNASSVTFADFGGSGTYSSTSNPSPGLYTAIYTPTSAGDHYWYSSLNPIYSDFEGNYLYIGPGAPAQIRFSIAPAPSLLSISNPSFTRAPQVTVYDRMGNQATQDYSSQVSLSAFDGANCTGSLVPAGLGGILTRTVSGGFTVFSGLSVQSTAVRSIQASFGSATACHTGVALVNSNSPVAGTSSQKWTLEPQTLTLPYTDPDGDLATSCMILSPSSGLNFTTSCTCTAGVCEIRVNGGGSGVVTNGVHSTTIFYQVSTADGLPSNTGRLSLVDQIPIATGATSTLRPNQEVTLTLPYTDGDGDLATGCWVGPWECESGDEGTYNCSGLDFRSSCSCTNGICQVKIWAYGGQFSAGFDYTITTNGYTSASGSYGLTNSPPVLSNTNWAPSELIGTSTTLLTLPSATDPDGDLIDGCSVYIPNNVAITSPCTCSNEVCTVGVSANGNAPTSGSFRYSVSASGLSSQDGTATLSFAPMPNLTFDPPARNYGSITVGETGGSFGFTLTNSGTGTASGCSAPTVSPATHFLITSDSCGTAELAVGASCVVQVAPVPTSSGTQSATLSRTCANIPISNRTQSTTSNGLTVTAKASAPVLTTYVDAPVDFGNIRVGSRSSAIEVILTNSGFGTLTGCTAPTLTNSSDYTIVSDTCGTSNLAKSASCVVTVAASPTTTGTLTSTLNRACTQSTLTGVSLTSSGFSGTVSALTLGDSHTCALMSDGRTRCWGLNTYGQLGDGTTTQRLTPIVVSGIANATSVVTGTHHSCALLSDSTVSCWGRNNFLQSGGTASASNSLVPTQIQLSAGTPLTGVSSIAAGTNHTCAVLNSGTVFCWGQASVNGTASSSTYALQISNITDASISAGSIAGGSGFACAVRTGGGVRCWGLNANKQLGNNTTATSTSAVDALASVGVNLSGVSAIASGASTTCALTSGSVKCWGAGALGQLGNGTTTSSQNFPVSVSGISTASSIVGGAPAGNSFCVQLSGSAGFRCWGSNSYGILGDGTSTNRSTPVSVSGVSNGVQIALGISHACVLSTNTQASVQCWGNAVSGQTGKGLPNLLSPKAGTLLSSVLPVSQVMAGGSSACALTQSGSAQCWGTSASTTPYLGNGGSTPSFQSPVTVTLGTGLTATAIAPGNTHSCVLLNNSTIKCWGVGSSGQIGNGATSAQSTPQTVSGISTAIQVGSGNGFSCALLSNKTVWCWGSNTLGQLGNAPYPFGTGTNAAGPVQVSEITDATQISVGYDHACALLTNQTVKCWGDNSWGQYGNGSNAAGGSTGNDPSQAAFTKVMMISTGYRFTCALLNDNTVQCAGYGTSGTLGNGLGGSSYATPAVVLAMEDGTGALTRMTSIVSNYSSTCGIRKSNGGNQLVCWGRNENGNNGLGNLNNTSYRKAVEIPGMLGISSVTASVADKTICAIDTSGTAFCFGNNDVNQAGVDQMGVQNVYGL